LQWLRRLFQMSETDQLLPSDEAKVHASTILDAFEQAETELVGKP